MADVVNMYTNITEKQNMRKSNIHNLRNLKITVIFWQYLVYVSVFKCTYIFFYLDLELYSIFLPNSNTMQNFCIQCTRAYVN